MSGYCEGCGETGGCSCGDTHEQWEDTAKLYANNADYWKQRAEKAEAIASNASFDLLSVKKDLFQAEAERDELRKWKEEAEKQDAVGYAVFNGFVLFTTTNSRDRAETIAKCEQMRHDLSGSLVAFHVRPLYTKPIPSPDVEGLQKRVEYLELDKQSLNDTAEQYLAERTEAYHQIEALQKRVEELERYSANLRSSMGELSEENDRMIRKLAEQQLNFRTLCEWLAGCDLPPSKGEEELNALLAQAREEGRKEAVPDGWEAAIRIQAPEGWSPHNVHAWDMACIAVYKHIKQMLSVAPKITEPGNPVPCTTPANPSKH